jgi:CheY-like chemotaxis protein
MIAASMNQKGELDALLSHWSNWNQSTRVLVVEAIPDNIADVKGSLKNQGVATFDTARNLDSAFTMARDKHYDLLLVDYRMPDGNGLDLLDWVGDESEVIMLGDAASQRLATNTSLNCRYHFTASQHSVAV